MKKLSLFSLVDLVPEKGAGCKNRHVMHTDGYTVV